MSRENWIWMGHAGHFILGHKCRFKMCTYVNGYIVSTVGELIPDNNIIDILYPEFIELKGEEKEYAYINKYECEDIGYNRKYETMVFKAEKTVNKCCPFKIIVEKEMDCKTYNDSASAFVGHYKLCEKWDKEKNI